MSNLSIGLCGKLAKALVGVHLICWIATYPVDKVVHSLNNWGLIYNVVYCAVEISSHQLQYIANKPIIGKP